MHDEDRQTSCRRHVEIRCTVEAGGVCVSACVCPGRSCRQAPRPRCLCWKPEQREAEEERDVTRRKAVPLPTPKIPCCNVTVNVTLALRCYCCASGLMHKNCSTRTLGRPHPRNFSAGTHTRSHARGLITVIHRRRRLFAATAQRKRHSGDKQVHRTTPDRRGPQPNKESCSASAV